MVQRAVALCNGKYIGIETIYTAINGRQINVPEKLKELRVKSRNKELFCPCGCGRNLILVAGDKSLRDQHFRIDDGRTDESCKFITEGKISVESKIVLKCWLDDNLHADDLESRVPICDTADINRRYEFTFITKNRKIALDYCYNRANLSDEKQSILDQHSQGLKIIHVVDYMNGGCAGQYPEGLMKIQHKQKYCLLLAIKNSNYENAEMKASFYDQDIDGLWKEIAFSNGLLKEYRINQKREISFRGKPLEAILEEARQQFIEFNATEKQRRDDEKKKQAELLKRQKNEYIKSLEKQQKLQAVFIENQRVLEEKATLIRAKYEEDLEKSLIERRRKEEDFKKRMALQFEQQETQVRDEEGKRWIKCEYCGKIAKENEFTSYGGPKHINLGMCKECANNPEIKTKINEPVFIQVKKHDSFICPDCGGKLVERVGRNGKFIGCSNYPRCRYTRSTGKKKVLDRI